MKVMTVFGTRPEGIKMSPLINHLKSDKEIECVVVNTAQHREMLDQVLNLFHIKPDYDLNIMKEKQTPESLTADIIMKLSIVMKKEKPDIVLVHGDTTTTFAGAYSAFLNKIPIGHVEAGLRTHNIYSPFPEEMNRQLVGRLSTFHFAATERNKKNLLNENINEEKISVVGNTVIDALFDVTKRNFDFPFEIKPIVQNAKKTILMTTHRRENLENLKGIYDAINALLEKNENIQIVFPVHKNPAVRNKVTSFLNDDERIHLLEPLAYETFAHLMKHTDLIITDSGGIQEEAPALGIPVLVARDTTERQEGVEAGTLKLVGTDKETIFNTANALLNNEDEYKKMAQSQNPYGQGNSSQLIVEFIKTNLKSQ